MICHLKHVTRNSIFDSCVWRKHSWEERAYTCQTNSRWRWDYSLL